MNIYRPFLCLCKKLVLMYTATPLYPDEQVWREVNSSCVNGSRVDWPTFTIAAQVKNIPNIDIS